MSGSNALTWRRALTGPLALVVAVLIVGALATLVSPSLRHELRLSSQRERESFVELYFPDVQASRRCTRTAGHTELVFTVHSHLDRDQPLEYLVSLRSGTNRPVTRRGVLDTVENRTSTARVRMPVKRTKYTVEISLPGRSERLLLHCGVGNE